MQKRLLKRNYNSLSQSKGW